jgi:Nucleotidyltransferase domain.
MSDAPKSSSDEAPPWPTPNASRVQEAVRRLVDAFDPLRIVVFGSHAREEMHPSSDLDLLVVLPEVEHKRDAAVAMRRVLSDLPVSKDIVVATPEEIEARCESTWHIIARALDNGSAVYSKEESRPRAIPNL